MAGAPNFFIVGAAKSGTTSLWMYLKQHPNIFMPTDSKFKEPAYYCRTYGMTGLAEYTQLFEGAGEEKAIGEASTAYMTAPESAALLHDACPEAKIIIILRNPIDRAYSLYRWMVNHGYEWLSPFEKALACEYERKDDADFFSGCPENFYNYMYFHSGLYSEQLSRYFSVFPAAQIKVLLMDDLKQRPAELVRELYGFLGVDATFKPDIRIHNKAELRPLSVRLHFAMQGLQLQYRHTRMDTVVSFLFDSNLKLFKLRWPALRQETRARLLAAYRADIEKTASMLGRDLSIWLR